MSLGNRHHPTVLENSGRDEPGSRLRPARPRDGCARREISVDLLGRLNAISGVSGRAAEFVCPVRSEPRSAEVGRRGAVGVPFTIACRSRWAAVPGVLLGVRRIVVGCGSRPAWQPVSGESQTLTVPVSLAGCCCGFGVAAGDETAARIEARRAFDGKNAAANAPPAANTSADTRNTVA